MKNPLSEIYSNKVLLSEEKVKSAVVTSKMEIGKAPLVKGQGSDKAKKDVETPEENKKYSDGAKAKDMTKESIKSYEGAFEKLFKATITEEEKMEFGGEEAATETSVEVPTETEDMVDELEDEDSGDLISDLRSIMDKLQDIMSKLSEEGSEETEEVEESEEEDTENEEPYEESVSMEDKGHALHGMKAGTEMMSKGHMKAGSVKPKGGSVHKGELKDSPEPKELGDKKGSLQSKKGMQVNSTVKTGDFFK